MAKALPATDLSICERCALRARLRELAISGRVVQVTTVTEFRRLRPWTQPIDQHKVMAALQGGGTGLGIDHDPEEAMRRALEQLGVVPR